MSNFSNSDHHQASNAESHQPHNNSSFFNNDAFSSIDGFLGSGHGESLDQSWNYTPEQYNVSGNSGPGWADPGSQQHLQQPATFRPGARPDQIFSASSFANNFTGSRGNVGFGGNANNFTGYLQHQYNSSTISPSSLSSQASNAQGRFNAQLPGNPYGGGTSTVSPEALQSNPYASGNNVPHSGAGVSQNTQGPSTVTKPRSVPLNLPRGDSAGNFVVINADRLRQATSSRGLTAYLDVGQEPYEYPISKSSIPIYYLRKSRNDIKRLLASDSRLKAKINKKLSKKSGLSGSQSIPAQLDSSGKLTTQRIKKEEDSSSEETSDSEYESSDEEPDKPPLPATRPSKPRDATRYDTIKCLWRSGSSAVPAQSIREGLKDFHEILSTIKDRWKSDNNAVKDAEAAKKVHEIPLLKERVKNQLDMLEAALKAANEYGHPDILDHFGSSLAGVGMMAVFLQDRIKETDYGSGVVLAILQFLSKCKLFDSGTLEKSNVGKLLTRFGKRGDDKVKLLAKRIENNAIAASKKKRDAPKPLVRTSSGDKDSKSENGPKSPQNAAGVKRPRPAENSSNDQPAKKVAAKPGESATARKPVTTTTTSKASGPAVAKSSSFISSLQSAKRPVAKPTAGQAKPAPTTKSATESKPSAASPAGFSFASVLADVERAKDDKPRESRSDDIRLNETPEQRAKRLRRESRKSLRVSFKPEESLVEVRTFEHDPDEELGHDASQMRDVNDVGNEGKMFKLHQRHHEMMDVDEEDDTEHGDPVEQVWRAWKQPTKVEFQEIVAKVVLNYEPYGGGPLKPECPEKTAQQEREASTLVAVYPERSDIPPSPSEPGPGSDGIEIERKDFGTTDTLNGRIEEVQKIQPREPDPPVGSNPDINAILSALGPQPGVPAPPMQATLANLISNIGNVNAQSAPPAPPMLPSQVYGQPPAATDMNVILANLNASQNQQQTQPVPPVNQPPQNVAALLATLQSGLPQQSPAMPPPPPPPPQMQYPQMASMPQMSGFDPQNPMFQAAHQYAVAGIPNANMWQQPQQQTQDASSTYENEARKRWREQNDDDDDSNEFKRQKNMGKKTPNPKSFYTQTCKYYKDGRCNKGSQCTYRHEDG